MAIEIAVLVTEYEQKDQRDKERFRLSSLVRGYFRKVPLSLSL